MQENLIEKLDRLKAEALSAFSQDQSEQELYDSKVRFLGKKGVLTEILRDLGRMDASERPLFGAKANEVKQEIENFYQNRVTEIKKGEIEKSLACEAIDLTLPGFSWPRGRVHPISQVLLEMKEIFREMGFDIHEGPEIETDYYNFEALNFPPDHPARDSQDTFFLGAPFGNEGGYPHHSVLGVASDGPQTPAPRAGKARRSTPPLLLRTHTSPVQIRVMEKSKPPIKMVAPGAVYRRDDDVTHSPLFHQIEGLLVDRNVTLGHLKGVLEEFLKKIFRPETKVKFRPSFFPFTEPSAEVDIGCVICSGKGCRVCKQSGWLEIMGCGMVDPEVFRFVKIDPEKYTGFAFGIGIERVAMLKHGIDDIRLFYENDLRFLEQF